MFELGQEVVANYLGRRRKDSDEIARALLSGEWEVIERIGHQIKGNGAMFGFPELSPVGKGLEESAKSRDSQSVGRHLGELRDWLSTHP